MTETAKYLYLSIKSTTARPFGNAYINTFGTFPSSDRTISTEVIQVNVSNCFEQRCLRSAATQLALCNTELTCSDSVISSVNSLFLKMG